MSDSYSYSWMAGYQKCYKVSWYLTFEGLNWLVYDSYSYSWMAGDKKCQVSSSSHLTTCGLDLWYCKLIFNIWRIWVIYGSLWYIQNYLKQTINTNKYSRMNIKWNKMSTNHFFPAYIRQPVPSTIGEFGPAMKIVSTLMYSLLR